MAGSRHEKLISSGSPSTAGVCTAGHAAGVRAGCSSSREMASLAGPRPSSSTTLGIAAMRAGSQTASTVSKTVEATCVMRALMRPCTRGKAMSPTRRARLGMATPNTASRRQPVGDRAMLPICRVVRASSESATSVSSSISRSARPRETEKASNGGGSPTATASSIPTLKSSSILRLSSSKPCRRVYGPTTAISSTTRSVSSPEMVSCSNPRRTRASPTAPRSKMEALAPSAVTLTESSPAATMAPAARLTMVRSTSRNGRSEKRRSWAVGCGAVCRKPRKPSSSSTASGGDGLSVVMTTSVLF
mmetsp:Transcript_14263/g.45838  ORF Transcript_14263/g.45838 Transcript_14263/m.45838 type:complete len:304 (+) Transcript_14263:967-1878(+)